METRRKERRETDGEDKQRKRKRSISKFGLIVAKMTDVGINFLKCNFIYANVNCIEINYSTCPIKFLHPDVFFVAMRARHTAAPLAVTRTGITF